MKFIEFHQGGKSISINLEKIEAFCANKETQESRKTIMFATGETDDAFYKIDEDYETVKKMINEA